MIQARRIAFTLVELLVVIAIIGVLIALMLPAIQASREMANRTSCTNNLTNLSLGLQNYEMAHQSYPPGTIEPKGPIRSVAVGDHRNWIIHILPYLDEMNAYRHVDQTVGVYHTNNAGVRAVTLNQLVCPSEPGWLSSPPQSNYAGVHHDVEAPIDVTNNGVLFLNSRVKRDDITDGLAHTLFLGEKIFESTDLGWMSGTRATLKNTGAGLNAVNRSLSPWLPPAPDSEFVPATGEETAADPVAAADAPNQTTAPQPAVAAAAVVEDTVNTAAAAAPASQNPPVSLPLTVGGFASGHSAGVNFVFGDGSVRFIPETINLQILQQLAHRADGKLRSSPY